MIMGSNESYCWSAKHFLPVHCEEGHVACERADEESSIVCHVELLRVKGLIHATKREHAKLTK